VTGKQKEALPLDGEERAKEAYWAYMRDAEKVRIASPLEICFRRAIGILEGKVSP
jgi:hypothetical protein